mmetsp:Transcript_26256/g.55843  ORF Transcript_26256/g.55843 Transcript_26256/m.55843 type:complete len:96 (+) Transcript_26256:982-1269(+)
MHKKDHEKFMKDMQEMFTDITNDKKHYSEMARDVLVDQPLTFQMAYAMWSRSPASYREQKAISPLVLPYESHYRRDEAQARRSLELPNWRGGGAS